MRKRIEISKNFTNFDTRHKKTIKPRTNKRHCERCSFVPRDRSKKTVLSAVCLSMSYARKWR